MPDTQPPALRDLIAIATLLMVDLIPDEIHDDSDLVPFRLAFTDVALDRTGVVIENTLVQPGVRDYADATMGIKDLAVGTVDRRIVAEAADDLVAWLRQVATGTPTTPDPTRACARDQVERALSRIWSERAIAVERAMLARHRRRRLH